MNKNHIVAYNSLLFFVLTTAILSMVTGLAKIPFVILQGFLIVRCFCLMHDLGHRNIFSSKWANDTFGVLMSLICCVPYFSWKYIHNAHHKWAGYKDLDPTETDIEFKRLSKLERFTANVSWKFWIPLLSFLVSVRTFWNIFKLRAYFNQDHKKQRDMISSILLIMFMHACLFVWLKQEYLYNFLFGYICSLFIMDPLVVAHHVGIHHDHANGEQVVPYKTVQQNQFARTIIFPDWFAKHVILGFNYHSAHHVKPYIPGHKIEELKAIKPEIEQDWLVWIKDFKSKKLEELL